MGAFVVSVVSGEYLPFTCIMHKNFCEQTVDPDQTPHVAQKFL